MWGRGGKDIDLTSPRAKDWKYRTVEQGKTAAVRVQIRAPDALRPSASLISAPRPASTTVATAQTDTDVLGRFNALGKAAVIGAGVVMIIAFVVAAEFFDGSGWGVLVVPAVVFFGALRAGAIAMAVGAYNVLKHNGRAVWVEGDKLKLVDWSNGLTTIRFDQFSAARFEPAYRRNKTTEPVILLQRPDKKPLVIGVRHIDVPGADLAARIEAVRAARAA